MHFPLHPLLSDEDKAETSEGGLDPLGLVQVSEALAVRLVPGVRERMSHPRYLTAMTVAMEVCRKFPDETVARDGISPPSLVFEWIAVEGFARTAEGRDPFKLPGSEKAATALRERVPLSAARYLKTPGVFGFNGVYRGLARDLDIDNAGRLGETGYVLLTTWAKEQKLDGFTGTAGGDGAYVCEQLYWAVRESLQAGAVARRDGWQYWRFFREHLAPHKTGSREAVVLRDALFAGTAGFRGTVLRFLVSDSGRKIFANTQSERSFHTALRRSANPELGVLLDAIESYETFCRICQDAFDDVLVEMTRRGGSKVTSRELGRIETVKIASKRVPEIFGELLERLEPFRETARFADTFASLAERTDAASWADRLLGHHIVTQRKKPPVGKSPWFERFDDGGVVIRPLYRREQPGRRDDSYVHAYRTGPLYNGATRGETRQRLMLTFNSPFFPEVLIASSVMAEGVDLHRYCRYVIHHDLDWNPSTLEQRTGRVDRIGAKVETCGQPIRIYLPFVAETQDEKMYRVVTDRERWFSVVMGERFKVDARNTENLAQRIPLPTVLASQLAFRLQVFT